jgi:hypothetical protein
LIGLIPWPGEEGECPYCRPKEKYPQLRVTFDNSGILEHAEPYTFREITQWLRID